MCLLMFTQTENKSTIFYQNYHGYCAIGQTARNMNIYVGLRPVLLKLLLPVVKAGCPVVKQICCECFNPRYLHHKSLTN